MEPKMLDAKYHIDSEAGCRCRYVKSDTEYFRPHNHNYYELFMILKNKACHIINGEEQLLNEGDLLFIRDFDIHDYKSVNGEYFEFLNLAFSRESFRSMQEYLGAGFPVDNLLRPSLPPTVKLTMREKEALAYDFIELNSHSDPSYIQFKARTLLISVFSKFFYNYTDQKSNVPSWLELTYEKMKQPQNFIAGTDKMFSLAGKTREHVARSLQQYYHITPTAYVNELRLEHAAKLLIISNLQITDICYECGFENLSWFYKSFSKKYGVTPAEYRKRLNK